MKFFSMYSGIGGFDLPLTEIGLECVGYSEIEKRACEIYEKHLQGHVNHGNADTIVPEYRIWLSMRRRCFTPTEAAYKNYGGRGITVSKRWDAFEFFIADMGKRPSLKHSIERVDNNGNYGPENCIWAVRDVQNNNTRKTRRITFQGKTRSVVQWSKELGIHRDAIYARLRRGIVDPFILLSPKDHRMTT